MGPDVISSGLSDDGAWTGPILRGYGQKEKRIKYVNAMLYVLGHCQRIMGSVRL